jgi:hypothetical protein
MRRQSGPKLLPLDGSLWEPAKLGDVFQDMHDVVIDPDFFPAGQRAARFFFRGTLFNVAGLFTSATELTLARGFRWRSR